MMAGSGALRDVVIAGAVATVPAHMYGTMHRLSRICSLRWKEACATLSFAKARAKKGIRIFVRTCLYNLPATTFIPLQMGNWGAL